MVPSNPSTGRLNPPNLLTMFRIAATPAIVVLMLYPQSKVCTFLAALMFCIAAVTDFLDGFMARRRGLVSNFGKVMDPIADKLLVSSSFIMLVAAHRAPAWIICLIIGREIGITGLRNIIAEKGGDVSASMLGKYKTGFQIAAIIPLLLHFPYFGINFHSIGIVMLWGALIYTVWSGVDYFVRFKSLIQI